MLMLIILNTLWAAFNLWANYQNKSYRDRLANMGERFLRESHDDRVRQHARESESAATIANLIRLYELNVIDDAALKVAVSRSLPPSLWYAMDGASRRAANDERLKDKAREWADDAAAALRMVAI